jgi:hypothetical protein
MGFGFSFRAYRVLFHSTSSPLSFIERFVARDPPLAAAAFSLLPSALGVYVRLREKDVLDDRLHPTRARSM